MNIRPARNSDRATIATLQAEIWNDAYSDVLPEKYLANQVMDDLHRHWEKLEIQPNDVVLVAENEELLGFIAVWCRPDPYIDNLHVKPSKRSGRVGSELMKSAARQIMRQGRKTAYLWVVDSNERAIRFYQRLGGVCVERAAKNLFGYKVSNVKVVWPDISVIDKDE